MTTSAVQQITPALSKYLRKDVGSDDAQELERLAKAAIALVERETGWTLTKDTATETHDGDDSDVLFVDRAPLVSVSSLSIDEIDIPASTGISVLGYVISGNMIRLRGYTFSEGVQNIEVTLVGGYETIPADFVQKIVEIAAFWFVRKTAIGQASTQFDRETVTYQTSELSDGIKAWLNSTRRRLF